MTSGFFFSFDFRLVRFQDPLVRTTQPAFVGWIVLFRSSDVRIVAKRFCDQPNRAVRVRMGVFRLVCLIGRSASFLILIGRASPSLVRVAKKNGSVASRVPLHNQAFLDPCVVGK